MLSMSAAVKEYLYKINNYNLYSKAQILIWIKQLPYFCTLLQSVNTVSHLSALL